MGFFFFFFSLLSISRVATDRCILIIAFSLLRIVLIFSCFSQFFVSLLIEINRTHMNEKYLPGVLLPDNVVAVPDVVQACRNATHLVFVIPHQFLERTCRTIVSSGVVDTTRAKGEGFD